MRYRFYRSLMVAFLFCEILITTSQRNLYFGKRENGIVLLILAAAMGLFAVLAAFESQPSTAKSQPSVWENRWMKLVAFAGIGLAIFHFNREIRVIPIDIHISDIVPTIQVMNHRLLEGQYPYALIQDFGYDLSPTYLPLMWLPFLPAALFHFDERWVAFAIWAIATLSMIRRAHLYVKSDAAKWLITALPFFFFLIIEQATDATFGNTIEIMIAGFYMLFALQLTRIKTYLTGNNPWKNGAMLAFFLLLCLLSRYSFLLWLPLGFMVIWLDNRKLAGATSVWVLGGILVLFVLPFLTKDPMIYVNGLKHYSTAALACWSQPDNVGPLFDGFGVAEMFRGKLDGGDMAIRLANLQKWQVITSFGSVIGCGLLYWKKRSALKNLPLFLLGSLKLYFAFFYGFIQVPYLYLMITPCFLSIVLLIAWYREEEPQIVMA